MHIRRACPAPQTNRQTNAQNEQTKQAALLLRLLLQLLIVAWQKATTASLLGKKKTLLDRSKQPE